MLFVKIDAEGSELQVLRGLRRGLQARRVTDLVVEITPGLWGAGPGVLSAGEQLLHWIVDSCGYTALVLYNTLDWGSVAGAHFERCAHPPLGLGGRVLRVRTGISHWHAFIEALAREGRLQDVWFTAREACDQSPG